VRREQLTATQAAFSRFSAVGIGGTIERQDLPNFLRYVVTSMSTSALPQAELSARSSELTQQLLGHLPPNAVQLSVSDIMQAAEKVLITPPTSTDDELSSERGNMGSKQLRLLRSGRGKPGRQLVLIGTPRPDGIDRILGSRNADLHVSSLRCQNCISLGVSSASPSSFQLIRHV
jgi:hypothetical protein